MVTTKLKGQITADHRLVVSIPDDLLPGNVDVILLQATEQTAARPRNTRQTKHPAFGLWADRTELADSAAFAAGLRSRLESRADGSD